MAELAHVLIGGVPYPVETVEANGLRPGIECVRLLESVGRKGDITKHEATTYFGEDTLMLVTWEGERHPTTGRRVLKRGIDPREAADPARKPQEK